MEIISGEWGKTKTFPLPFITFGGSDWLSGVTLELGDVQIAINGGAYVNIPLSQLSVVADHVVITLSNTNMQLEYAIVRVKDQTATKVFEDTGAILATSPRAWVQAIFSLIESQRGSHTGKGQLIFWDPIGGNDDGSGLVFHEPKQTYNFNGGGGIHSLMNNNSHDIIIALPNPGGGPTIVNEYFENDKAYNFFRGPGRDWQFKATHNESCAVVLSAEGCELSGCRVETKITGSQDAICASGDFAKIHRAWVDYSRGSGIKIDNASSCELEDFVVQDSAQGGSGHALHILGDTSLTTRNIIGSGEIFENGNGGGGADGIRIDGANCEHNFIHGGSHALLIHDNTGWGIQNVNGAVHTIIVGPTVHVGHNDLGDVNVDVTSVAENIVPWATSEAEAHILQSTTIATLASQTEFTLTAGSSDDDAYNGASIIITDAATAVQKAVGTIFDYIGSTKGVALNSDPAIFTMAVGDTVQILLNTSSTLLANAIISEKVDTLLDINKPQDLVVSTTTRLEYQWLDKDKEPVDISLLTFKFKAVKNAGESSPQIPEVTGTIQDGPNGRWYFDVLPTTVFKGRYEIWADDGAGVITPLTMAGGVGIETHPRL